jgi:hypothetical protein
MITRSPKTPCEDKQSESLRKPLVSLGVTKTNGGGVTELYDKMLDCRWQCFQTIENLFVLFRTADLLKFSFRSNVFRVKKSHHLESYSTHLQSSMSTQAVGPMGARMECDRKGRNGPWLPMMIDLKT